MEENNRRFKVTGSILVRLTKSHPIIDMIDCDAYIMAETANTYCVRFYTGTPYIVSKQIFMANTKPGTTKDMNYHEIHDVTLLLNGVPKKTYRGVFFGNEDYLSKITDNALRWFNMEYGVHWDDYLSVLRLKQGEIRKMDKIKKPGLYHIKIDRRGLPEEDVDLHVELDDEPTDEDILRFSQEEDFGYDPQYCEYTFNLITAKEMAKKTTSTEVATTAQSEFEVRSKEIGLPTIPSTMVIGGVTFSEDLIKKELEEVKKIKVEAPLPTDTREIMDLKKKVYDEIVEKKKAFVKTRTQPEKFRQEISKPLNAWIKELKNRTDSFGELAKEGEQYCIDQAKIYEDWENEQKRLQEEAEAELTKARTLDLQSVLGIVNPQSLHWTFKHNPRLVEQHEILSMDDSEWNGLMKELEDSFKAAEAKVEEERQAFINLQGALKTARIQMLQLMGYAFDGNFTYSKNGHTINDGDVARYQDAEWMTLLQSHNTPKEATNPFAAGATTKSPSYPTNPFTQTEPATNPFITRPELGETTTESMSTEEAAGNTFTNAFTDMAQQMVENPNIVGGEDSILTTEWPEELPFVEFVLNKSTIRIYPFENESIALEIPSRDERHMYSGRSQDNGLCYIMYKNA